MRILNKRVFRELKKNLFRYLALFLLITFGMYLIVSIVGAAEMVICGVGKGQKENNVEDGEFTVFAPLDDEKKDALKKNGVELEEEFYLDYDLKDGSTIRIFQNRNSLNKVEMDTGKQADANQDVVLEKLYADAKGYAIGDMLSVGDENLTVSGTGSTPDYDYVLKEMSDMNAEKTSFGTAFVNPETFQKMVEKKNAKNAETYVYAYKLSGKMTAEELRDDIKDMDIDKEKVTDTYFLEQLNKAEKEKTDLLDAVCDLNSGAQDLSDGLIELQDHNEDLSDGAVKIFDGILQQAGDGLKSLGYNGELTESNFNSVLDSYIKSEGSENAILRLKLKSVQEQLNELKCYKDGMKEYTDGEDQAADGAAELADGTDELKNKTSELIDKYFDVKIGNLVSFTTAKENPRIGGSVNDVQINKYAGMVAGVIVMGLFTFVISVFVIHGIDKESTVIGALYALGLRQSELIIHYLKLPVILTFFAGLTGTALGFSPIGVGTQVNDSVVYFSMPILSTIYPAYLIIYGIIMPPLVAAVVNYFVIKKRLSRPALSLMRQETKKGSSVRINLNGFSFLHKFQIRQFLRERRINFTIIIGMFICLLILMMGIDCYMICHNMSVDNKSDTRYQYMYTYKYESDTVPDGGEACYAEGLKKEAYGYHLDVVLFGIDQHNSYFDFKPDEGQNKITLSSSAATKFKVKAGDKLVLTDEMNGVDYAFTVDKIVPYSVGLYGFMNIEDMRTLFGKDSDYFNVVLSDKALDIDPQHLNNVVTRDDLVKSADVFSKNMQSMVICLITVAIVIFVIVMYLMMKVAMDRSALNISFLKVFGYNKKEIGKLYLDGNFYLVAAGAAICIPLAKVVMDLIYPYFVSNVATGMNLSMPVSIYFIIYAGILLCYLFIRTLLLKVLEKIQPAEALKNRD